MYKIALLGKAGTGKDTTAKLIDEHLDWNTVDPYAKTKFMAFADPIKEIAKIMYPDLKKKWLYGPSKFRAELIDGALDEDRLPLTVRKALLEIGTKGRESCPNIWMNVFLTRFAKQVKKKRGVVIVTDARFRNEFDMLKSLNFYMVRIRRNTEVTINHDSETNQDTIQDSEFNWVIENNAGLNELTELISHRLVHDVKIHQA